MDYQKHINNSLIIQKAVGWHLDPNCPRGYTPDILDQNGEELLLPCPELEDTIAIANLYSPWNMELVWKVIEWCKEEDMITAFKDWWKRYSWSLIGNNFQEEILDTIVKYIHGKNEMIALLRDVLPYLDHLGICDYYVDHQVCNCQLTEKEEKIKAIIND
jgi:hypothetical protein